MTAPTIYRKDNVMHGPMKKDAAMKISNSVISERSLGREIKRKLLNNENFTKLRHFFETSPPKQLKEGLSQSTNINLSVHHTNLKICADQPGALLCVRPD